MENITGFAAIGNENTTNIKLYTLHAEYKHVVRTRKYMTTVQRFMHTEKIIITSNIIVYHHACPGAFTDGGSAVTCLDHTRQTLSLIWNFLTSVMN